MALQVALVLLMVAGVAAEFHSLAYHELMSDGDQRPLQRVVDGYVRHVHFVKYRGREGEIEAMQEWMTRLTKERRERRMNTWADDQWVQREILQQAKKRLTRGYVFLSGTHWVQRMSRCMWDDETGEVIAHHRFAYRGKAFLAFYLEKKQWIALTREAETIKDHLNGRDTLNQEVYNYLTQDCPERLKMYLEYGSNQLLREVPPKVFLLQKNSSSPIACLATAFFPQHSQLFWRKDGEVMRGDDVSMSDTFPNLDGTFQRKAELPPVRPEDWSRYECVFQSYGQADVTRRLDEGLDRNPNEITSERPCIVTVIIPIVIIMFITIIVMLVLLVWCRKQAFSEVF
ncbi:zinc-alpha-2-glycoprotein-like [Neosynchiropus ocellatus]